MALFAVPNTDRADCSNAAGRYAAAVAQVRERLRAYESCLAAAPTGGACADEIEALDDAHDAFADAVADMAGCRQPDRAPPG